MDRTRLTTQLFRIYITAVIIVLALISGSQAIIQLTLFQEVGTRDLANTVALQALHSQRLLRNAILVFVGPNRAFNPTQIPPGQQLQADQQFLEKTNATLLGGSAPSSVTVSMQKVQPDFRMMDTAVHLLLADAQRYYGGKQHDPHVAQDAANQLATIFVHEQAYLSSLTDIYNAIDAQANAKVTQVRWTEATIYTVSLAIFLYEVFFVVLPSLRAYQKALADLDILDAQTRAQGSALPSNPPTAEGAPPRRKRGRGLFTSRPRSTKEQ